MNHLGPSSNQLLDALESCPELRELELQDVRVSNDTAPARSPIVLLALTRLYSKGIDYRIATRLLPNIVAPKCTKISIYLHRGDGDCDEVHNVTTAWIAPVLNTRLLAGGDLRISISHLQHPNFHIVSLDRRSISNLYIDLALPGSRARPSTVEWGLTLIFPIATQPHNPLTVRVNFETILASQLIVVLAILRRLPQITMLELSDYADDLLVDLLKKLSWGRVPASPGGSSWLCPDLRELHIEGCSEEELLLDMVAKRTQAAALKETGAEVNAVARLRKLRSLQGSKAWLVCRP